MRAEDSFVECILTISAGAGSTAANKINNPAFRVRGKKETDKQEADDAVLERALRLGGVAKCSGEGDTHISIEQDSQRRPLGLMSLGAIWEKQPLGRKDGCNEFSGLAKGRWMRAGGPAQVKQGMRRGKWWET